MSIRRMDKEKAIDQAIVAVSQLLRVGKGTYGVIFPPEKYDSDYWFVDYKVVKKDWDSRFGSFPFALLYVQIGTCPSMPE